MTSSWTSHTFPKEFNSIWFPVVVLSPLQHSYNMDYNFFDEGKESCLQNYNLNTLEQLVIIPGCNGGQYRI